MPLVCSVARFERPIISRRGAEAVGPKVLRPVQGPLLSELDSGSRRAPAAAGGGISHLWCVPLSWR